MVSEASYVQYPIRTSFRWAWGGEGVIFTLKFSEPRPAPSASYWNEPEAGLNLAQRLTPDVGSEAAISSGNFWPRPCPEDGEAQGWRPTDLGLTPNFALTTQVTVSLRLSRDCPFTCKTHVKDAVRVKRGATNLKLGFILDSPFWAKVTVTVPGFGWTGSAQAAGHRSLGVGSCWESKAASLPLGGTLSSGSSLPVGTPCPSRTHLDLRLCHP